MSTIKEKSFVGKDLSGKSLVGLEFHGCNFTKANLKKAEFEDATFVECDLSGADLVGATFRLSCVQGVANKLTDVQALMFLYWFNHVFTLSPDTRHKIEGMIGSYMPKLKAMFDREN